MTDEDRKEPPPLFGDDAPDSDTDDMFSSAVEGSYNNNLKSKEEVHPTQSVVPPLPTNLNDDEDDDRDIFPESGGKSSSSNSRPEPDKKSHDVPKPSRDEEEDLFHDDDTPGSTPGPTSKPSFVPPSSAPVFVPSSEPHGFPASAAPSSHDDRKMGRHEDSRVAQDKSGHAKVMSSGAVGERKGVEDDEEDRRAIEILVSDPKKIGDGMNAYVVYKITTRTNLSQFRSCEFTVTRRFSDFLGLHEKLVETHHQYGRIIPPPPEKSVVGATKVKMMKEESGSTDFVEKRRAALERFLNRIAKHPDLCNDFTFIEFLESSADLPKATSTSALSGAGVARFFSKVGDSINKMTYTMAEPDEWFEDKQEEIEAFDIQLKELHTSLELLVLHRKDLAQNTSQFAKSVAMLGSAEDHMSLSKALSCLAEIESKVDQLYTDQSDSDFFVFSELVKDYLAVIQSIKDVFQERVKQYRVWQDAIAIVTKKKESKAKLEQQHKPTVQIEQDITDSEERMEKFKESFERTSGNIRRELARFDRQRVKDFKAMMLNYLQAMMNNQQQLATCWESFLPEARAIT